jgi:hypothetical protein
MEYIEDQVYLLRQVEFEVYGLWIHGRVSLLLEDAVYKKSMLLGVSRADVADNMVCFSREYFCV